MEKRVTVWVQKFPDRANLVLQWHDPVTGKRKSKSAKTADEKKAEQAAKDLEYELNHGKYVGAATMTWAAFRERFTEEYAAFTRTGTRQNYDRAFNHFERLCSPRRLASVDERMLSGFVTAMRKMPVRGGKVGLKLSTIKVVLEFLHTSLSWAKKQKLIAEVPNFPRVEPEQTDPQPVPAELFERLLAAAGGDPAMRAFFLCGWLAGLRFFEALSLRWSESDEWPYLDLANDRLFLPARFVKGRRDQWVPLNPELRAALEALPRSGPAVFARPGGGPWTHAAFSKRVSALARKAGVKLTMKSLRRGFACRHAQGVSAQVLQRLMRHANIATTMRYYANVDDAAVRAVMGDRAAEGVRNGARRNDSRNAGNAEAPGEVDPRGLTG